MSDLRSTPKFARQAEPQPWLTARRGDIIELAGAAVVVLLVLAIVFVAVRDAHSDGPEQNLPQLPFAGSVDDRPASQGAWP
ncbi:MAG: hypothetical protein ACT4QF_07575 [Sporichthyaceae bacterium]